MIAPNIKTNYMKNGSTLDGTMDYGAMNIGAQQTTFIYIL